MKAKKLIASTITLFATTTALTIIFTPKKASAVAPWGYKVEQMSLNVRDCANIAIGKFKSAGLASPEMINSGENKIVRGYFGGNSDTMVVIFCIPSKYTPSCSKSPGAATVVTFVVSPTTVLRDRYKSLFQGFDKVNAIDCG